jgi:hypothetical protein
MREKFRNTGGLALVLLILAVLGCSCPKLKELAEQGKQSPTPSSSPYSPTTSPTTSVPKGDYDVSMDKYNQISIGTSRADVERILGGKGTEVSSSTGGGVRFSVIKWTGDSYKSIILTFKNDKVITKTQVGLK